MNNDWSEIDEEMEFNEIFKGYEEEYSLTKNEIKKQLDALAIVQKERPLLLREYAVPKLIGYVLIVAIIALYLNDQILFAGILTLVFIKHIEYLVSELMKVLKKNFSLIQRDVDQKSEQSSDLINGIRSNLDHLFYIQQDKDKIIKEQLRSLASDIELNAYRIEKMKNEIPPKTSSEFINSDIDEKMIEHKNWSFDTTFLLLKKISNEEFETPVPEIVLKRIAHMCDHTDKNELDQDDVKNIKGFTGGKDVVDRILKALNIELFIRSIHEELEEVANTIPGGNGAAQFIWLAQKQYLKEKYNIDWLSPQDLRPDLKFF